MSRREAHGVRDGGGIGPGVGSALESSDPARIGPYQLLSRLGSGGMGKVYLGRSRTGHLAAVKVLHDQFAQDREFRTRFGRELDAASRVSGRFTAAVLASSGAMDEERLWMATEYVPGPSLNQAVSEFGPLDETTLVALWLGLLGALESIHAAGIVHRDLKPSNVLLAEDGPRLIDFGISALGGASTLTRTGVVVGTPGYMSPEEVQGHKSGPPSDVFALACTLKYAATGTGPFEGGTNLVGAIYRVIHDEPDLSRVPYQIASLIRPCLDKDPLSRPSVTELINTLPAAGRDEVSRLLAHGRWLPEAVRRQTREHAGKVFEWDDVRPSALPAVHPGHHEDSEPYSQTGTFSEQPRSQPDPTPQPEHAITLGGDGPVREPIPEPPTVSGGSVAAPPNGSPPNPPGPYDNGGPEPDPANGASLRTHTVPLPADLPPLPRIPRRPWRRWLPDRRGTR
ncbi:serine/threonine-protein kinase [Streptomyces lydicus]|uniref:serine/threonine-protein kinase n=1 Tax=Streptomyces lydicus TaxID=47763 RepID=UPI003788AB60